ncbi:hypothetical protein ABH994_003948 [Bradyrhizobium yuanmingense]
MRKDKTFRLVLIRPSHYDDDGYVIRWWRGGLPSNSLACLYGIALDCRERGVLGPDCNIEIDAIDETNWKVRVADLARAIKTADAGMVMLVGVQSNQFPRSLDLARQFASSESTLRSAASMCPAPSRCCRSAIPAFRR